MAAMSTAKGYGSEFAGVQMLNATMVQRAGRACH
jgi:hypothetical protein